MPLLDDVHKLQGDFDQAETEVERLKSKFARQDEQINGERGLSAAINALTREVASLRRAGYWVAGIIVAGSITFAFAALRMFA